MFLYKLEIELSDRTVYLIVAAESDEKAFTAAEVILDKHYVASPTVKSMALMEKKRVENGSGYVIETS